MTRARTRERGIERHRRDVTSALYWLVWHGGMSANAAEALLHKAPALVEPLAELGRVEGRPCFLALAQLIDEWDKRKKS